jgi:hypothetical protein
VNDPRLAAPLAYRTETLGQRIALGNSREPPAFKFPSRTRDKTRYRQVLRYALKRLPSSRPPNPPPLLAPGFWLLSLQPLQELQALCFGRESFFCQPHRII